jgi:mono/diheme cytochrome c family protein
MAVAGVLALGAGAAVWLTSREEPAVAVRVPELSAAGRAGKELFDRSCAQCHGGNARGSEKGPPLVHRTYRPGHHADVAFELAVRRGVRAHHWRFGDMPAQPAVTSAEVGQITRYIRELQQANGIF